MPEVGYDLTTHTSKGLEDFNGKAFDDAATMGCGDECPLVLAKQRMDWQIPDRMESPNFRLIMEKQLSTFDRLW